MSIIWLTKKRGITDKERWKLENMLKTYAKITPAQIRYLSIHSKVDGLWKQKGKTKWTYDPAKKPEVFAALRNFISTFKPKLIVINDPATLGYIAGHISLELCRGGVYFFDDVPVLVFDDIHKDFNVKHYTWVLVNDIEKIGRWYYGKQRPEPKFQYTIIADRAGIIQAENFLLGCKFFAYDVETKGTLITCLSITGIDETGRIYTFIYPFVDPRKQSGCYWDDELDEVSAWESLRRIFATATCVKIAQNGNYDNAYFILYGVIVNNYLLDTQALFHAIWTESPKKLNFIASICLDYMRYWKDELKGAKQENVARTDLGFNKYLRYNGLDTHYTLLSALYLLSHIIRLPWAMSNFNTEFSLQVGPCFSGSMTGFKLDKHRQAIRALSNAEEFKKNLDELRILVDNPEFNPRSPAQVAELFYDVLGAPLARKTKKTPNPRSTDEKWLKLISEADPLLDIFYKKLMAVKKPANNISKYGVNTKNDKGKWVGLRAWNGRFMYSLHAQGTETGRLSSSKHQYWLGTNAQNMPRIIRDMLVADEGYVIADFDYSQSDAVFVAFESQDENYIRTMTSGQDTHLIHCAHFFKHDIEKLKQAKKDKAEWLMGEPLGIRYITKRLVHGSNFRMAEYTLYMQIGRDALVSAASNLKATARRIVFNNEYIEYLHIPNFQEHPPGLRPDADYKVVRELWPHNWTTKEFLVLCSIFLTDFHKLYPGLQPWFSEIVRECVKNGNLAACAFGRTRLFFGNVDKDESIQRELTAYFGQGGTAGNINRSLLWLYYQSTVLASTDAIFVTQTHDSLTFLFKIEYLHECVKEVLTIMEKPFTIKGREVVVKAEAKVGLSWGLGGMGYKETLTYQDILNHEQTIINNYKALEEKLQLVELDLSSLDVDGLDNDTDDENSGEQVSEIATDEMEIAA